MAGERQARVADRIRVVLAERLERGLRDPRLGFVTITDVRVTGDLQHASIFYTVYGSDEERADSAAALKAATGMLRSEVGRNITARLTPSLEFIPDGIPDNAALIENLLSEARLRDEPNYESIEMPRNNPTGFICAFFATIMGFALIWHIWWLVIAAFIGAFATFVWFAWRDHHEEVIPAETVARIDRQNRRARSEAIAQLRGAT